MIDIEFGKRFEMLMESTNLTNTEITEKAELSKNNVGNYKKGQIPNAQMLYRLSQLFGVSMEYLLTGKESGELTAEEQQLVDNWRRTADQGRKTVQDVSNAMANTYPRQETSSSSKIG